MSISADGYVAGPDQSEEHPLGWWGDTPPYHRPVFVLTHYPHDPIEMQGGTTVYFVTDGIDAPGVAHLRYHVPR